MIPVQNTSFVLHPLTKDFLTGLSSLLLPYGYCQIRVLYEAEISGKNIKSKGNIEFSSSLGIDKINGKLLLSIISVNQ